MPKMKAIIFVEPGRIVLDEKPIPDIGPLDALIRITTTTICGTDVHILKGEYPVAKGLTVGHEPVGVIEKLGSAVSGYHEGQRMIRRGHHSERPQQRASLRLWLAGWCRHQARLEGDRRLEIRQHHRRLPGRICVGAGRHGQSKRCAGGPHGRASPDVPGHNVGGLQRHRERGRPDWGYSGRFCPGGPSGFAPRQAHGSKAPPPFSSSIRLPNGLPYRRSWEPTSRSISRR